MKTKLMQTKELNDAEYERMKTAYDKLLDWMEECDLEDKEALGLLMKASMSIATFHEIPKVEVLHVISFLYDVEKSTQPAEMH